MASYRDTIVPRLWYDTRIPLLRDFASNLRRAVDQRNKLRAKRRIFQRPAFLLLHGVLALIISYLVFGTAFLLLPMLALQLGAHQLWLIVRQYEAHRTMRANVRRLSTCEYGQAMWDTSQEWDALNQALRGLCLSWDKIMAELNAEATPLVVEYLSTISTNKSMLRRTSNPDWMRDMAIHQMVNQAWRTAILIARVVRQHPDAMQR